MSTAGPSSPQAAVEAFVQGQIDLVALEDELEACCAKDESAAWDALALLDQFYRRGRIADADFRVLKKRVNRHAQKPLGSASYRSHAESPKGAAARLRSTLAVPVGEIEAARDAAKEDPLQTRALLPPDSRDLGLDLDLDSAFEPGSSNPVLEASRDLLLGSDLDIGGALDDVEDLPPMHTRELPARPATPVAPRAEPDAAKTLLLGRADPTVMVSRTAFLDEGLAFGDDTSRDPLLEPTSSKPRDFARPVEPTIHEGHRVLRDRFELGPLLGRGGMASVFQARDRHRDGGSEREQWVAVKVLNDGVIRADEGARALQREFQHLQTLAHPSIVKILDFDYDGATPFLVMELLEGENLESMLARGERFSRRVALTLVHHLAVALKYAHDNDIVHADFKPGNVMVTPSGQVKILDLGVSWRWQREPRLAAEEGRGSLLATPAYASQEVLNGGLPEVRDDIFSLGCLAYELMMGEHPFRRIPITKAVGQGLQPKRIPWLTRAQWRTLASSLSWNRESRPASVQAFLDGLGLRGEAAALPPPSKWGVAEASRVPMVIRGVIGLAACALVAVALVPQLPQWWGGADAALAPGVQTAAEEPQSVATPLNVPPSTPQQSPPSQSTGVQPRVTPPAAASTAPTQPAASAKLAPTPPEPKPAASTPSRTAPTAPAPVTATFPSQPALRNEASRESAAAATAALAPGQPGRIAFASSTINVSERDSLARIDLVRSRGSQGRVGVRWETEEITALKDADYADMGEQMAWFDNGQTRVTLLVPLVVGGEVKDVRAFRVRIKDPEGGAQLSGATEAMVVISDE